MVAKTADKLKASARRRSLLRMVPGVEDLAQTATANFLSLNENPAER